MNSGKLLSFNLLNIFAKNPNVPVTKDKGYKVPFDRNLVVIKLKEVGIVISTADGPTTSKFSFVVSNNSFKIPVRRNQFVTVTTEEGLAIALITNIRKTNRYFMHAESVKDFNQNGKIEDFIPIVDWEYVVADAKILGVLDGNTFDKLSYPPSPGAKVYLAKESLLKQFLGIDENGLYIGKLENHDVEVRLNLTRLLQKHFAILALSGSGKSYLASVLIEELLDRKKELGRVAVVVIDVHGEYVSFAEDKNYADKVEVIEGSEYRIGVSTLYANQIASFIPNISPAQRRDLARIIEELQRSEELYSLQDIIRRIQADTLISRSTKQALIGWLEDLKNTGIFSKVDYPALQKIIRPGRLVVLDLSNILSLKIKQIIVAHITEKLFFYRRNGLIPPYLEIIEEAHQFAPEKVREELAISKKNIETLAREGRKFHACLCVISQRPLHLSTTVLSQCNTHLILRITNPYDLDHIGRSSEAISRDDLESISTLKVGEVLVVGEAVNYPIFVKVRRRKTKQSRYADSLEATAARYEKVIYGDEVKREEQKSHSTYINNALR